MGIRTQNLKGLFSDVRTRTIIIITLFILLGASTMSYFLLRRHMVGPTAGSTVAGTPRITSIPGSFNPTPEYSHLVQQANLKRAQSATKTGSSALPTIIRAVKPGEGQVVKGVSGQPWETGLGFKQLARVQRGAGTPKAFLLDAVKQGNCDKKDLENAIKGGATSDALREAGCTPERLRDAGFSSKELQKAGFSACDLISSNGVDPNEMKNAGYSAGELRGVGYNACQLRKAGFTAAQLAAAAFTPDELKGVGFTPEQIAAAGAIPTQVIPALPPGVTLSALKAAGCGAEALKRSRAKGVSAAAIRSIGCNATQLRAGGYTAQELKAAGLTAGQLKAAGFTAQELKAVGYTPSQLHAAGFTLNQLRAAGLTPSQLRAAGFTANQLRAAGLTPSQLQAAGISAPSALDVSQVPSTAAQPTALAATVAAQQKQIASQQLTQLQQQMQSAIAGQVGQLLAAWTAPPSQSLVAVVPPPTKKTPGLTGGGASGGVAGSASQKPPIIKAGSIVFAVLDTSVNSDYPGPILATIVSGKFSGARLMGRLTTFPPYGKKVMLNFSMMDVKSRPQTISVNAVAIDPDTARTALSSHTNNHYLLRFGSLFAASFLEGLGQAFLQSGQMVTSTSSSTIVTSPGLSTAGKGYVALGNVGNKFGSVLENVYNMPPTVQVYSGTGLGILFLSDVAAPTA